MERNIQQALDDVGEIKRILNQTGRDLSNAARLFFLAGAVWAAEGLLQLAGTLLMTVQPASGVPTLGIRTSAYLISLQAIHWGGWLAVLLMWLCLRRRQKELSRGLGLQLLDIWGCFLVGVTLLERAVSNISAYLTFHKPLQGVPVWYLFLMVSLPLMLFLTGVLTGKRGPSYLAAGWIALSLILLLIPWFELPVEENITMTLSLNTLLCSSLLPGLFLLALGALMMRQREASHA